jgi:hypothetical protein
MRLIYVIERLHADDGLPSLPSHCRPTTGSGHKFFTGNSDCFSRRQYHLSDTGLLEFFPNTHQAVPRVVVRVSHIPANDGPLIPLHLAQSPPEPIPVIHRCCASAGASRETKGRNK